MIVVADSSPLVALVTLDYADLLLTLFDHVFIPPEVASELASPNRPVVVQTFITTPPNWITIRSPNSPEPIAGLHSGEVAAIALARDLQADLLLIDERHGRQAAKDRGLNVVGTIGLLELAAESELIDLEKSFEDVKKTDFWINPQFLDERLNRFLQRKQNR